ncbi:hypothetical protein F5B19DRAFT_465118 [Rostrohypoxylon terebratum]|nr:hypothetical protein F5B19DRAFT_465118 [Rostrohypoxylon terebratum]
MGDNYTYPGGMPPYQQPYPPYQQSYQQQGYPEPSSPRFPQQGVNINADERLQQPVSPGRVPGPYMSGALPTEPFLAYQYNPGGTYLYPPQPEVSYYNTPYSYYGECYEDSDSEVPPFQAQDPPPPYKSPLHSPARPDDGRYAGPHPETQPEPQETSYRHRSRSKSRARRSRGHRQSEHYTDSQPKPQTRSHRERSRSRSRRRSTHESSALPRTPERRSEHRESSHRHHRTGSPPPNLRPTLHRKISQEQLKPILKSPSINPSPRGSPQPSPRKSRSGSQSQGEHKTEHQHEDKHEHKHSSSKKNHHHHHHHRHSERRQSMSVPNPSNPLAPSLSTEQDILTRGRDELAPLLASIQDVVTYEFALPSHSEIRISFSLSTIDLDPPSHDMPTTWSLHSGILRSLIRTPILAPVITIIVPAVSPPPPPPYPTQLRGPDHGVIAACERVVAALRYGSATPYPSTYLPITNPYPANPLAPGFPPHPPPHPTPLLPFRPGGELFGSNYVFRYGPADRNTILAEATWVYMPVVGREGVYERFEREPRDGGRALRRWARGWGIEGEVGEMFGR